MSLTFADSKSRHEVELRISGGAKRCFYECDIPQTTGRLGGFIISLNKPVARVQIVNDADVILWQSGDNKEGVRSFFAMNNDVVEEIAQTVMYGLVRAAGSVQADCATVNEFTEKIGKQLEEVMSRLVLEGNGKKWLNLNATGKLRMRLAFMDYLEGRHESLSQSGRFSAMSVTQSVVDESGKAVLGLGRPASM